MACSMQYSPKEKNIFEIPQFALAQTFESIKIKHRPKIDQYITNYTKSYIESSLASQLSNIHKENLNRPVITYERALLSYLNLLVRITWARLFFFSRLPLYLRLLEMYPLPRELRLRGRNYDNLSPYVLERELLIERTVKSLFKSYASQLMTLVTTWRNLDGNETSSSRLFWRERRAIPYTVQAKVAAAQICFPVITAIAIVESTVYKVLHILGKIVGNPNSGDYELLYQSSSFSILWSLGNFALYNLRYTNLYTEESLARIFADTIRSGFLRPVDRIDLSDYFRSFPQNERPQSPVIERAATIDRTTEMIVKEGARFLNDLLKNEKDDLKADFASLFPEAINFVLFKTMYHFAVSNQEKVIPDYLNAETQAAIRELRDDASFQEKIKSTDMNKYLGMTPDEFDEALDLPEVVVKLKGAFGREYQGSLFLQKCTGAYEIFR